MCQKVQSSFSIRTNTFGLCVVNRPFTFEDKLGPTHDVGGVEPSAVASTGVDGEGGVLTDGVRVVEVVTLPGVVFVVEDEVASEEEDLGANLAALAHPLAVQTDGQVGPRRQDGRVKLVRAVDDATGDAAVVVILHMESGRKVQIWQNEKGNNL